MAGFGGGRKPAQNEPQPEPKPDDHAAYRPGYTGSERRVGKGVYDPAPLPPEQQFDDICHMNIAPGKSCGKQKRFRTGKIANRGVYLCPNCDRMDLTPDESIAGRSKQPMVVRPFDECSTNPADGKPRVCKHCRKGNG